MKLQAFHATFNQIPNHLAQTLTSVYCFAWCGMPSCVLSRQFVRGIAYVLLLWSSVSTAEPWLSTRFAQNCAGCHAPGRYNLPPKDRRCSLSCQGCHVNPNGGGLRSQYGKWNEDRWLTSFRSEFFKSKRATAPLARQRYAAIKPRSKQERGAKEKRHSHTPSKRLSKKALAQMQTRGASLIETPDVYPDERAYLRDGREFETVTRDVWLQQIPQEDPYRTSRQHKIEAGGDVRWQVAQYSLSDNSDLIPPFEKQWKSFLMAADFGIRYKPLFEKLSIVYEARILGNPNSNVPFEDKLANAGTRSLYVMVDDLPYNMFVMAGAYKPLFGTYSPDHYNLAQEMLSFAMTGQTKNYSVLYRAVSVGTAPNVPYLNLHLIQRRSGDVDSRMQGYAVNTGLRFVTLGASLNYSYWNTKDVRDDDHFTYIEMHAASIAAKIWRFILNLDAMSFARDDTLITQDFRQGGVYGADLYLQVWRENYFTINYAQANTTATLQPGRVSQLKVGTRSFLFPGVDLSFYVENRQQTSNDQKPEGGDLTTSMRGLFGQLHVFF